MFTRDASLVEHDPLGSFSQAFEVESLTRIKNIRCVSPLLTARPYQVFNTLGCTLSISLNRLKSPVTGRSNLKWHILTKSTREIR